jgi:uncharacterized protein (TIGR03086 family)
MSPPAFDRAMAVAGPRKMSYPRGIIAGMDDVEGLARFDRAVVAAGAVFDGVKVEQWGDPTPCPEWTVRDLMNHVVGGTRQFISLMTGGGQLDRSLDYLGPDPAGSFRDAAAKLRAVFAADGALERLAPTPFGPRPGHFLAEMRVAEMMTHGWDLARATGQSTDLDPELAESLIDNFRRMRARAEGDSANLPFDDEQPVADDARPADRLAAAAGRRVG